MKIYRSLIKRTLLYAIVLSVLATSSPVVITAAAPDQASHKVTELVTRNTATKVQPIVFVPKNLIADSSYLSAVNNTMKELSEWYGAQLGGTTFNYAPAIQVIGQYELRHYCPKTIRDTQCVQVPGQIGADPNDINNVLADLSAQGYSIHYNTIFLIFWVGGYGYAAGSKWSDTSGMAAVGDWALDGIAGKYEAGTATSHCEESSMAWLICTKNAQIGAVGHELGHAFDLPHPSDDGSQPGDPNYWRSTIMAVFWDYPDVVLIDSPTNPEKTTLLQHPFFWAYNTFFPVYAR